MSKKQPILFHALLLTAVNLVLRLVSTSFQVYLSGKIGAAGIGLLQLVLSVGGMAMTAGIAGIRTATMYLTARELGQNKPQNVTHVLSACFLYSIICSGCIAVLLFIFAPLLATHWIGNKAAVDAIKLLACFLPISCLCGVMTGYFTAANRIGTLSAVEVAEQLCSMVITMSVLTVWANEDAGKACQAVVFGSGIGSCLTLLLLTVLRIKENAPSAPPISLRKPLLETAVPLAVADDVKAGINTTENIMVPKRLRLYPGTENPLAAFGTVCGMVFPVLMFPAAIVFSLAELLIPEMARCAAAQSKMRIRYLTKRSLRIVLIYALLFSGLLYLLSETLCFQLYQSKKAGQFLSLYAPLAPMLYCDAIIDAMNKGLGQQKICVRYNILTAAMDVFFLFILLPKYGMIGYYISFVLTHALNFILSLNLLMRTAKVRISLRPTLLSVFSTVISVTLSSGLTSPLLRSTAFILLFFSTLTIFGIISRKDIVWIKGLIKNNHPSQ